MAVVGRRRRWPWSASPTGRCGAAARPAWPPSSPPSASRCSSRSCSPLRYGRDFLGFPRVLEKRELFEFGGANVRTDKVLVFVAALVLMVALDRFVAHSRLGRGIRATAQDAETAALMGVNIDRVVMLTFLLGGLLAGAAGTLYGVFFESARYNIGFLPGIKAFTAAVLGGIGNIRGALLGGLLLGLLENWGATVLGGEWKDVFAFTVLVLVLMFRPTGLLGETLGRARA